jgi:hypothetical protein
VISEQARTVVERIFADAMRAHLPVDPSHRLELSAVGAVVPADAPAHELMIVTSSSFRFRLLTVFHLRGGVSTAAYYGRGRTDIPPAEAFGEVANLCCGAINRELARYVPHMGMSTPYVLNSHCLDFLGDLQPQHVARYDVAIGGDVRIGATLCLCGSAAIDFSTVPLAAAEQPASTGDLEFF